MTKVIGLILIIVGVCIGLYVGLWLCFVGGIVGVIEAIRADVLVSMDVAIGIAKVIFSGFIGFISGGVFIVPGWFMFCD